ncbi:MAG TPA: HAMP domain-containing sensor histidine kinase [Thermoanaerobaculia bacterium]
MERRNADRLKFGAALAWWIFTLALASWWFIFGLRQAGTPTVHRMLVSEGSVLMASLLVGGAALLYGIRREQLRHNAIEEFFAAFTHDLRTSLTSMRLQVESLDEDLQERGENNPLLQRLLSDSVRLQLQLDNSLFYANRKRGKLFIEQVSLRNTIDAIAREFSGLTVSMNGDMTVLADVRALEVVIRNLFQNALIHGGANAVDVCVDQSGAARVAVRIEDNGSGAEVDVRELGRLFFRPTKRSGTGVGLYISRRLAKRMHGLLTLSRGARGLVATLELQKAPA